MKTNRLLTALCVMALAIAASAQSRFDQGVTEFTARNYDAALTHFQGVLQADPTYDLAQAYMGIIKYRQSDYKTARELLSKASETISGEQNRSFLGNVYYHLGLTHEELGDTASGIAALSSAIHYDPSNVDCRLERAIALQNTKNFDEALEDLNEVLQARPDDLTAWVALGYTQVGLHNRDAAIDAFKKAASLDAANAEHYNDVVTALSAFNPDMSVDTESTERDITEADNVVLPKFPGGTKAMNKIIAENIVYHEKALDEKVEGTVVVDCLIDKTGKVSKTKVVTMLMSVLDDEAQRVCMLLPAFEPATRDGAPVECWVQIPVKFTLPK
ncbi:MAG: TonB family protein [Muribaculaceae bacterium]|nr:TonB family protein [Muribaculaceae bacterium]